MRADADSRQTCGLTALLAFCLSISAIPAKADTTAILSALDSFRLDEAATLIESSELPFGSETRFYLDGRVAAGHYRADEAIQIADACLAEHPDSSRCHELRGEGFAIALAQESDSWKQMRLASHARKAWRQALAIREDNVRARVSLMRYYQIAPFIAGGSDGAAKRQRTQLIAQQPHRTDYFLGMHAWARKDWPDAVRHLRAAVGQNPTDAEARYYLALSRIELGAPVAGLDELSELVDDSPQFWEAWFNLGVNAIRSSVHSGLGLKALYTFVRGAPAAGAKRLANAWYAIGRHYETEGRHDQALDAYANALEAKPGHNESGEAFERLRSRDESAPTEI